MTTVLTTIFITMTHTKKAFATVCGIQTKDLSVYIQRKRVVVDADGEINIDHPLNKIFLEDKLSKNKRKAADTSQVKSFDEDKSDLNEAETEGLTITQLTRRRKILDIKKIDKEVDLLTIKRDKLNGEVIPTELVKIIMYRKTALLVNRFKDHWEDHLTKLSGELRLSGDQLAKLRGEMVYHINQASDEALNTAKKEINQMIDEFKITRAKGEKK